MAAHDGRPAMHTAAYPEHAMQFGLLVEAEARTCQHAVAIRIEFLCIFRFDWAINQLISV